MMTIWPFLLCSILVCFFALGIWLKKRASLPQVAGACSEASDTVSAIEHALLQSNLSAIVAIDKHDRIIEFNPSAERLFKLKRQQVLGLAMAEIIIPERYRQMHYAGMKRYQESGSGPVLRKRIEVSALNADHDEFPIEMEITPVESANGTIFVAVINDISERENSRKKIVDTLKQAEEANRAKSRFLTSVSHEIRTPLHAILSLIECLQHTALSDLQLKYVSTAQQAGDRLLNMVNDILDLGQIEAGKREVHLSWCRPKAILEEHLDIYRQSLAEKGLEVYLIESDVPRAINTDITMLRQILSNLLSNACKYTEVGGVTVHSWSLQETLHNETKTWWCCEVTDTGKGLTAEQIQALFQEFTRFHQDGSSSGTGVGLMISRLLAQQLGGELTVQSTKEVGTTFRLSLPIARARPKRQFKQLQQLSIFLYSNNERWLNCLMQQLANLGVVQQHIITKHEFQRLPDHAIVIVDTQTNSAVLPFNPSKLVAEEQRLCIISAGDDLTAALAACPRHFAFISQPYRRQDIIAALRAARSQRKQAFALERATKPLLMLSPPQHNRAFHILLVDDSEVNRLTIGTFLGLEGIRVTEAANGEDAVNVVRNAHFDLILMDMRMPVMDGIQATQIIRNEQLAIGTPIIALTAHVQENEKQRCITAGMQDFLTKPIGKSMLIKRVMHWLAKPSADDSSSFNLKNTAQMMGVFLDESILGRLQHNLPVDKFQSLLNIFLSEIEKQILQVHAFLRDQNYEQIEILAHAMKSSTYAFGATRMSYLAKCIEEACQQQQLALVKQYCVFIDNARQETETEFKRKGYARASET